MNCQDCNKNRMMGETALAMAERTIRRLWITILVLIVLMAGMAIGFFVYESQFEDYTESVEIDAEQDGDYNFVSGDDLNYVTEGESKKDNQR